MRGIGGRRARRGPLPAAGLPAGLVATLVVAPAAALVAALAGCSTGAAEASGPVAPVSPVLQPAPDPAGPATASPEPRGQGRVSRTFRRPDGSLRVLDVEDGFSLDLPRGFTRVTSSAALRTAVRAAGRDPGPARLRAALAVAAPGGADAGPLLAVDPARGAAITVLTTPAGGADGAHLTGQAAAIRSQLENTLDARVTVTVVRVDGEPALRGQARPRSGRTPVRLTELFAVHAGRFYTVVLGEAGQAEPALGAELLGSLHFLD